MDLWKLSGPANIAPSTQRANGVRVDALAKRVVQLRERGLLEPGANSPQSPADTPEAIMTDMFTYVIEPRLRHQAGRSERTRLALEDGTATAADAWMMVGEDPRGWFRGVCVAMNASNGDMKSKVKCVAAAINSQINRDIKDVLRYLADRPGFLLNQKVNKALKRAPRPDLLLVGAPLNRDEVDRIVFRVGGGVRSDQAAANAAIKALVQTQRPFNKWDVVEALRACRHPRFEPIPEGYDPAEDQESSCAYEPVHVAVSTLLLAPFEAHLKVDSDQRGVAHFAARERVSGARYTAMKANELKAALQVQKADDYVQWLINQCVDEKKKVPGALFVDLLARRLFGPPDRAQSPAPIQS